MGILSFMFGLVGMNIVSLQFRISACGADTSPSELRPSKVRYHQMDFWTVNIYGGDSRLPACIYAALDYREAANEQHIYSPRSFCSHGSPSWSLRKQWTMVIERKLMLWSA